MNHDQSTTVQPGYREKPPYWLFLLFAAYGPGVNFMGQWRFVEIILLLLLFLNLKKVTPHIGRLERRFILLFSFTAFMHIIADLINDASFHETIKRVGTYLVLALLIIPVQWLSRKDPRRIAFMLAGFCMSWVLLLFIGSNINPAYALVPWRLGLGGAATLFLCVLIASMPRFYRFGSFALVFLAGVHVVMNARTLAAMAFLVGIFCFLGFTQNKRFPAKFRLDFVMIIALLAVIATSVGMYGLRIAVENKMLPEEMNQKMERQLNHPYGLLAAGRPETVTALYAISKKPFIGYGSTAYDADINGFHAELVSLKFEEQDNFEKLLRNLYVQKRSHGIPAHSHVFREWVDAGVLAAISWISILGLAIYVLSRSMFWHNSWAPLFVFVSISTMWDVLFSPGPTRIDIALKLMVMIFATHQFKFLDHIKRTR